MSATLPTFETEPSPAATAPASTSPSQRIERLSRPEYQTINSPAHQAVWDRSLPLELFLPASETRSSEVERVMQASLEVVRRHVAGGTLYGADNKTSDVVLRELAYVGYWGLLVDPEYGGSGASMRSFTAFLTRMATIDPTVAGLVAVHGCIGAVNHVRTFGNDEQKQRLLPTLARGQRLAIFALTEAGAGSDLTALKTTAVREGDEYVVFGEKLFISNAAVGRTVGLVCLIDGKPAMLIVELPESENEQFQLVHYGLHALKHTHNRGIRLRGFRVPARNLLVPTRGNGLTIAYHGLNHGRVALCANAAGTMRIMLAGMIPWARYRRTYGEEIARRELVRRRMARLAGLIVGADALVAWCSTLLDAGYRGEMECIVAKVFGSESLKEAAIELCLKTHGGRSFLEGHPIGDNLHEYLAPCIYEGEGEMLSMALFKSLVKQHGKDFFEPLGKAMLATGMKRSSPFNLLYAWTLRKEMGRYLKWLAAESLRAKPRPKFPAMPANLQRHAEFAARCLQRMPLELSRAMRKHQLKLADRQGRMIELSQRVQQLLTILTTSLYAAQQENEVIRAAADILCQDLAMKLRGQRPSDAYYRAANELGEKIADGEFPDLNEIPTGEILIKYD